MLEIRFHGRGGQGAVVGSEILAHAFFIEGKYVQAFPSFGVERRGAPVTAFCRVDDKAINLRTQIYEPDHVVVLDASMIEYVAVTNGLKKNGTVVINGRRTPEYYRKKLGADFKIFIVDASAVAVENRLGSTSNPIVNTAILGAFAKATGLIRIESIEKAIDDYVPAKKEENKRAAKMVYDLVTQA